MSSEQIAAIAPEIGVGTSRTRPAELWEAIVALRAAVALITASGGAQVHVAAAERGEQLAAALHKYLVELVTFDAGFAPGEFTLPDEWRLPEPESNAAEG